MAQSMTVADVKAMLRGRKTEQHIPQTGAQTVTLPENFPARDILIGAGYSTPDGVRSAPDADLAELDGIGPATLRKIREALR